MENIIKLIDISLENGRLSQDDYTVILKKAQTCGYNEEELNLMISKRASLSESAKLKTLSEGGSKSYVPYFLAAIAIVATFFDWIGYYSRSSVMGSSASWDTSFNAWWGGFGASIVVIYLIGCLIYFLKGKYFWIAGVIAIIDSIIIYSTIANADTSIQYSYQGYGASGEAGYALLWGFWVFIGTSILFVISEILLRGQNIRPKEGNIFKSFKRNFSRGWKSVLAAMVVLVTINLLMSSNPDIGAIIGISIVAVLFGLISLVIFLFSPSTKTAGYVLVFLGLSLCLAFFFLCGNNVDYQSAVLLLTYPISYIILDRLLAHQTNIKSAIGCIIIISSLSSCSDNNQPSIQISAIQNHSGTYVSNNDGIKSTITLIGDSWFGSHSEVNFSNTISTGFGTIHGNKIFDQLGTELGYVSNGKVYVNIGGFNMVLSKQ